MQRGLRRPALPGNSCAGRALRRRLVLRSTRSGPRGRCRRCRAGKRRRAALLLASRRCRSAFPLRNCARRSCRGRGRRHRRYLHGRSRFGNRGLRLRHHGRRSIRRDRLIRYERGSGGWIPFNHHQSDRRCQDRAEDESDNRFHELSRMLNVSQHQAVAEQRVG